MFRFLRFYREETQTKPQPSAVCADSPLFVIWQILTLFLFPQMSLKKWKKCMYISKHVDGRVSHAPFYLWPFFRSNKQWSPAAVMMGNRNSCLYLFGSGWFSARRDSSAVSSFSFQNALVPMASADPQSPDLKTFPRRCHFISNRCGCITSFTASDDTCPPPNVLGVLEVEPPPALPVLASADIYFKAPLILSDYI